ncbi:unnamed protein product [Owenia fusiformis]|uniref:Lethal giant larvae n=1 Tax=Owenia fusiformis TaxID=6347 RepID=A0A8S4PMN9_OWEFU|nr:unnamed protein product [Owenia fusiformis]
MSGLLRKLHIPGVKKRERPDSEARVKLQKELFAFTKCTEHGFPSKPSATAYDPKLKLLAIGTKSGAVRIVGGPGVEFGGQHEAEGSVTQLFFLPEQGRLISLFSDNSLHLWEVNIKDGNSVLEKVKDFSMENSKLKNISACCLSSNAENLLLGTEGGNIHLLDVSTFSLSDQIIYQDVVMQNVPDDFKVNPGAVEAIAEHPNDPNRYLIGYNRGLVVMWDNEKSQADQTYNTTQQLESVTWHRDGTQFMSAHADGSYIIWSTEDSNEPKEKATTPYGPFPCKSVNKVQWKTAKAGNFIIFSGGMPRASYGDRHTVSVMQGGTHTAFDFTSRVIDFLALTTLDEMDAETIGDDTIAKYDEPHTLLVLCEEELVAIDLLSDGWPSFQLPYCSSLHSSAITTSAHAANVPDAFWEKVEQAGKAQFEGFSVREWPITGGTNLSGPATSRDMLLTGHEDGSVRFWDASTTDLKLLYKLTTTEVFGDGPLDQSNAEGDEEWPPFRKVGTFDPYSDDPRLGIQKITLCPLSETLVIAGTAGQVVLLGLEREQRTTEVSSVTVNIVSDRDNFVWKGHEALKVRAGDVKFEAGFQPSVVMQLHPPAACTALAVQTEWQLIAAGTAHGYGLFDYAQKKEVATKCTLNPQDLTGTGESAMSRRKSFKKSLRESFRRLRRKKESYEVNAKKKEEPKPKEEEPAKEAEKTEEKKEEEGAEAPAVEGAEAAAPAPAEPEPAPAATPPPKEEPAAPAQSEGRRTIERQVEARPVDDSMGSMVRSLYFCDTFILHDKATHNTLWAGTNNGNIFVHTLTVPAADKRGEDSVVCQLAREIRLKHHAPVISIAVIDGRAAPLPDALEVANERAKVPENHDHKVVIVSEEQVKIFTLPNLKPYGKFKLTAHEGSRIRKVGFTSYRSRSDENYAETDISVLTNQGDLNIYTLPGLRRQLNQNAIRKEDVVGISSAVFTKNGQGFYLGSPSEYVRFSLSARYTSTPLCMVELKEGMRPPPPEPEPEAEPEVEAAAAEETPAAEGDAEAKPAEESKEGDEAVAVVTEAVAATALDDSRVEENAGDITQDSVQEHLITEATTTTTELVEGGTSSESSQQQKNKVNDETVAENEETVSEQLEELRITEEGDDNVETSSKPDGDSETSSKPDGDSETSNKPDGDSETSNKPDGDSETLITTTTTTTTVEPQENGVVETESSVETTTISSTTVVTTETVKSETRSEDSEAVVSQ